MTHHYLIQSLIHVGQDGFISLDVIILFLLIVSQRRKLVQRMSFDTATCINSCDVVGFVGWTTLGSPYAVIWVSTQYSRCHICFKPSEAYMLNDLYCLLIIVNPCYDVNVKSNTHVRMVICYLHKNQVMPEAFRERNVAALLQLIVWHTDLIDGAGQYIKPSALSLK